MARKMKKFADGGQARYDRMMKDIQSDYEKAKARKTGRAAEVAKAKYEQRMADAKDDLAKARGEDRSQTRAAERAAERNLTMTRRFGAPSAVKSVESEKPITSAPSVDTSKLGARGDQAITDSRSFSDAFRQARNNGNQPFTWRGKSYSTALASDAKPAAPAAKSAAPPAKRAASPAPAARANSPAPEVKPITVTAPRRRTEAEGNQRREYATRIQDLEQRIARARVKGTRPLDQDVVGLAAMKREKAKLDKLRGAYGDMSPADRAMELRNILPRTAGFGSAKGGKVKAKGYAKGGKIDGCAVRGKTRARRSK